MADIVNPKQLAQRIIRLSNRGNDTRDSQLHVKDVIPLVIDAANELLKADVYNTRNTEAGKGVSSHYIQTFRDIPVKKLTATKANSQNFIDLPSRYASLPNGEGVLSIKPSTGNIYVDKAMIPAQSNEMEILGPIVGSVQKQWVYEVENQKVYFFPKCGKTLCESDIQYVTAKLVVILGDISPNTPLQVPPEMIGGIITRVLEIIAGTYGIKSTKDNINDNNPDTLE